MYIFYCNTLHIGNTISCTVYIYIYIYIYILYIHVYIILNMAYAYTDVIIIACMDFIIIYNRQT